MNTESAPAPAPAPNAGGADNRDYLDKGLDAVEKKFGGQRFADPNKNRAMNEKITDFFRKMIEKVTGYVCLFSQRPGPLTRVGCCCCRCCCCDADTRCACVGRRCPPRSRTERCAMDQGLQTLKDTHYERDNNMCWRVLHAWIEWLERDTCGACMRYCTSLRLPRAK